MASKNYWKENGGFEGLLGSPLLNVGLGILGNNRPGGNIFAGAAQGLQQAAQYRTQQEEAEAREKEREEEEKERALRLSILEEDQEFKRDDRQRTGQFRDSVAGLLGGPDERAVSTNNPILGGFYKNGRESSIGNTQNIETGFSTRNPLLGRFGGQKSQLDQLTFMLAQNDPEAALSLSISREQAAAEQAQRDAQMLAQFEQQKALKDIDNTQADQRLERQLEAQTIRANQAYEANAAREADKVKAKTLATEQRRREEAKSDFGQIKDSEKSLLNLMTNDNFADAVGAIDSQTSSSHPFQTKDSSLTKKARRTSRNAVLNVIRSATFGGLSEGERQFIMDSVPQETDDEGTWVDWYNDDYLPKRNRIAAEAGEPPLPPMEIKGASLFSGGRVQPVDLSGISAKQKAILDKY